VHRRRLPDVRIGLAGFTIDLNGIDPTPRSRACASGPFRFINQTIMNR
jgi:hypothetical protein